MKQCYYVARLYSKLMPTIVEEFPFTNDFTDALIDAICEETIEEDDNEDIR